MNELILPLTKTQISYEFVEKFCPGSLNLCNGFIFKGKYDLERMKRAVRRLYERHDVMRMKMAKRDDYVYYTWCDEYDPELEIVELNADTRDERYAKAMIDARIRVREDILFSRKGMYRFFAYVLSDEELMLVYIANHMGTDGNSMVLLNAELEKLYENPDREDLPVSSSFEEFQNDRQRIYASAEYNEDSKYWAALMDGYKAPDIQAPEVKDDKNVAMECGAFHVPLDKIKQIARNNKTSNFNLLFLLVEIALAEQLKRDDICLHYIFAARFAPKYQNTFGFVAHGVDMRTNINKNITCRELIEENKRRVNEDIKHIDSADCVSEKEFILSYIPNLNTKPKTTFASLEYTPFVLHSRSNYDFRYCAFIAAELTDILYVYPMCDINIYGMDFVTCFGEKINRYVDRLIENPDITVGELMKVDNKGKSSVMDMLAELWRNVLELDELPNAEDDFFELGGNSYKAFFVMANLPEEYQGKLEMNDFYDYETLDGITSRLCEKLGIKE